MKNLILILCSFLFANGLHAQVKKGVTSTGLNELVDSRPPRIFNRQKTDATDNAVYTDYCQKGYELVDKNVRSITVQFNPDYSPRNLVLGKAKVKSQVKRI